MRDDEELVSQSSDNSETGKPEHGKARKSSDTL